MTEKTIEKISPKGEIIIPEKWREKLSLDETSIIELELSDDNVIHVKKKEHPLEIEDNLFEGIPPFSEEELDKAKKTLFTNK